MGLENSMVGQVAKALETTYRVPVIWEHFQECTCCSESFIRSDHPIVSNIILDNISLDYTLTLMAASGHQAEAAKQATMEKYKGEYILCVEGSVPMGDDGNYCCIGGRSAKDLLIEAAEGAKAIIAWGSCASNGCVQAASPNPTNATLDGKPAGTISLIRPKFASDFPSALSVHDVGLKDMVEAVYLMDKVPDIHLFTVSIEEISPMTIELNQKVRETMPKLINAILKQSEKLHLELL